MKTTGATASTMTETMIPAVVKTAALTLWSFLAFQEYLAVAAGNVLGVVGWGIAAVAELFLGLWIGRSKK